MFFISKDLWEKFGNKAIVLTVLSTYLPLIFPSGKETKPKTAAAFGNLTALKSRKHVSEKQQLVSTFLPNDILYVNFQLKLGLIKYEIRKYTVIYFKGHAKKQRKKAKIFGV